MGTELINVLKGDKDLFPQGNLCIHQLFERKVTNNPEDAAVIYNDVSLTYEELNEKANQLAHYLLDQGLHIGEPVGVCLERSAEMVISLMGILKAGGAYVPIDPTHPVQRIHLILQSLESPFIITTEVKETLIGISDVARPVFIDGKESLFPNKKENPGLAIDENSNMYIMFTSGTTGKPKGVMNTHKALNNRLQWMQKEYQLTRKDRVLQKTPYSFDVSVWEFFWPLITGASVVMAKPEGHKDPEYVMEAIKKYSITTIHFVPSMLQLFLDFTPSNESLSLKRVICSGEALKKNTELQFFQKIKDVELYNLYGPTEAAVDVTSWKCTGSKEETIIPIGHPISNTNLYIMNEHLKPVEAFETGELYIGGVGLAKGYYKQQELTREKFIVNPLDEKEILYKTGDLCKYRLDGAIEYLGRNDFQVKMRGFRIELSEIEYTFEVLQNIKECIVCGLNEGESQYLAAYVTVENDADWDESALRSELKKRLPEYMIPAFIMRIKQFPLSSNGKIDRAQLPDPLKNRGKVTDKPVSATEKAIENVWNELLEKVDIGAGESFLHIGGNSLFAARVVARLKKMFSVHLSINDVFENPTISDLSSFIDSRSKKVENEIHLEKDEAIKSLSYAQKRIWFIDELEGLNPLYNIPRYVDLKGFIDIDIFKESLNFMIEQNKVLQSNFRSGSGQPVVYQDSNRKCGLQYLDLTEQSIHRSEKISLQEMEKDASMPFDLAYDNLFRFQMYKLSDNSHRFYYNFHHIIFDGWSESVFLNNLLEIYEQKVSEFNENKELTFSQYGFYIKQQQNFMSSNNYLDQLNFWKEKLDGKAPNIKLSQEQKESTSKGYAGETINFDLDDSDVKQFERYCNSKDITLSMGMLALYKLFIYRLSNETDISVGIPVAGRNDEDLENAIGMFVNTLTIRNHLEKGMSFQDLLSNVKHTTLEALSNGDVPFEKIVESVQRNRMGNQNPLFQYMFVFQNFLQPKKEVGNLSVKIPNSVENGTAKFDLTLFIEMDDDGLVGKWEYRKDVFDRTTIEGFTSIFQQLLRSVNTHPDELIEKLPILTSEEENDLIYKLNQTNKDFPNVALHELFEKQVEKTPDNIAAEYEGRTLTYKQLDEKSNQLAHALVEEGVVPDTPVGLVMQRSLNLVVSLLGIIKAGGAYLPMEVSSPVDRVEKILHDADAFLCISDKQLSFQHKEIKVLHTRDLEKMLKNPVTALNIKLSPLNLVSVYYTSGSTGKPKGVSNTHQGWVNRMCWMQNKHELTEAETVLQKTTLTFDDAAVEFFWPLMVGGRIAFIPPDTHKDPEKIIDYAIRYNVSVIQFVPSMLQMAIEYITRKQKDCLTNLRVVVSSGEALEKDLVNSFHKKFPGVLYNSWGATEVSIDSTCYDCIPGNITTTGTRTVSVGKPIDNNRIYVLDNFKKPVPIGVAGDLYIAGVGLARGYLNNPEKTQSSFIKDPYFKNELMYRTGDRGYLSEDGNVMFIGREDNQIKIRGMRVELGEIESRVREISGIKDVVVLQTNKNSNAQLVVYYTTKKDITNNVIKNKLNKELPEYMVPSFYMKLETIPLNPNGKLDHNRLPVPSEEHLMVSTDYSKPSNAVEEKVLLIWQEQLNIQQIGVQDNLFELGGHSLMAVQIISSINKRFSISLPVKSLFDNPTIAGVSRMVTQQEGQTASIPIVNKNEKAHGVPMSDAQKRIWFLENLDKGTKYNMPLALEFEGEIHREKMEQAINQLTLRHEALRTTFIEKEGSPLQVVHDQMLINLSVEKINGMDIQELIQREAKLQFNLSTGPLLSGKVFKGKSKDVLVLVFHHIISDGWSSNIIKNELINLYNEEKVHDTPVQYPDFTLYQKKFSQSEEYQRQLSYWLNKMEGEIPLLQLPQDYMEESKKEDNITINHSLSEKLSEKIKEFSKNRKHTPFTTFYGVFTVLLSRLSQQRDVIVGTPLANRNMAELESAVGLYLNTLPLRMNVDESTSFEEHLEVVKRTVQDAFSNQEVPFEKIVEGIQPERNLNRNPLFDVLINYQSFETGNEMGDHEFKEIKANKIESKFFLTMYIKETDSGFHLDLSYRNDLFSEERMKEFLNQYVHLLNLVITQTDLAIEESSLVTKNFKKYLPDPAIPIKERDFPKVDEMINEIVERHPEEISVEEGNNQYSYKELSHLYKMITDNLVEYGVQPGDVVAVYGTRSYMTIAAVLGVLHANAVFLNMDDEVPENRMQEMLLQSQAKVVLAAQTISSNHQSIIEKINVRILNTDEYLMENRTCAFGSNSQRKFTNKDGGYIFFTSGTTGEPKGILGSYKGLSHFIDWQRNKFGISKEDKFAHLTSVTFDAFLRDVFLPLTSGATVSIPHKEENVTEFINNRKISVLHTVPSLAKRWITDAYPGTTLNHLRYVFFSGETLSGKVVEDWKGISSAEIISFYGQTETTMIKAYQYADRFNREETIPLGEPLPDTQIYILNNHDCLCGAGETGEVIVRTPYRTMGYLQNDNAFSTNSFANDLIYRSGDLGKYLPDGNIQILGRNDEQIKIRGVRINKNEIISAIGRVANISDCYVLSKKYRDKDIRLYAYLVFEDEYMDETEIRMQLLSELPTAMIPNRIISVSQIPITKSGKVDVGELSNIALNHNHESDHTQLSSTVEKQLIDIWKNVLSKSDIKSSDNFFELGGHSLLIVKMIAAIKEKLEKEISLKSVFQYPTVHSLASYIEGKSKSKNRPSIRKVERVSYSIERT